MLRLVLLAIVLLVGPSCVVAKHSGNHVAMMVQTHFLRHGVRLPTREFVTAMREAAVDISHMSCRKSLVMLAMANEEALKRTVPLFLESLRHVKVSGGKNAGQTFDGKLVLVAWSREAFVMCQELQSQYSHKCVRDAEHGGGKKSFGFHSDGFNALGFAKVKYILNALSAGHDVIFLDADIIIMRDPLPYFFERGGDTYAMMEKCLLSNINDSFASRVYVKHEKLTPPLNIGTLYFKATAGVTRCVYGWIWDMYGQVAFRPQIWDQDIFGVLMPKCSHKINLSLHGLDPRLFQSACYPRCGCDYDDANVTAATHGALLPGVEPLPQLGKNHRHVCDPKRWDRWLLRHFSCSGTTDQKAYFMKQFVEGYRTKQPVDITKTWHPSPPPYAAPATPPAPPSPPVSGGAG